MRFYFTFIVRILATGPLLVVKIMLIVLEFLWYTIASAIT